MMQEISFTGRRSSFDGVPASHMIENVRLQLRSLRSQSPASLALLEALRAELLVKSAPGQAVVYATHVTRASLAMRLNKWQLSPYDQTKLANLAKCGLVRIQRQPLPIRTYAGAHGRELRQGAGWQYVYSIPERVLYALLILDNPNAFEPTNPTSPTSPTSSTSPTSPTSPTRLRPVDQPYQLTWLDNLALGFKWWIDRLTKR